MTHSVLLSLDDNRGIDAVPGINTQTSLDDRWLVVEKVAGLVNELTNMAPETKRHLPDSDILHKGVVRRHNCRDPLANRNENQKAEGSEDLIESIFSSADEVIKSNRVLWGMPSVCRGRALFLTEGGRVGIGHETLQPGDQVWLLAGAKVPFLLRQSHHDHMKLVGETYVDGMMFGELWPADGGTLDNVVLE